jgi:2-oxoisovalerate dehydrogenase E1 component
VGLLRTALRSDDPTFFFEHRALLDTSEGRKPYPGDEYCLPFGLANRLTEGNELTVVTWGAFVPRCLQAARAFPGRVTVLDLRTILPWDQEAVLEAVRHTGKVLVVHEDTHTAGFGGEVVATISGQVFESLDAPPRRLTMPDIPIPFNIELMDAVLPTAARIQSEMEDLLAY